MTADQRARLVESGTPIHEVEATARFSNEAVWVHVSDIPARGVFEFGRILTAPGGEERWLASSPPKLRERLARAS